jgi:5'-deoxynucleotidase
MFERELRDLQYIPRWQITRNVRTQTLAEHSYYVALYASDICAYLSLPEDVTLAAIKGALWHDVPELITGDLVGPHKNKMVDPKKMDNFVTRGMDIIFGSVGHRDGRYEAVLENGKAVARHIVKCADLLDAAHYLIEEVSLGNRNTENKIEIHINKALKEVDVLFTLLHDSHRVALTNLKTRIMETSTTHNSNLSLGPNLTNKKVMGDRVL